MGHGLYIVAVRVQYESTVIILVIMRPRARGAIIPAASGDRGVIKGLNVFAVGGYERHMQAAFQSGTRPDPELRPVATETGISVSAAAIVRKTDFLQQDDAKRRERLLIKG